MGNYRNFKTAVYIPAEVAAGFTQEQLASDCAFLAKYIGIDKVYLETHRNSIDVETGQLVMIRDFLAKQGMEVSGGITATVDDFAGAEPGKQRLFGTFCYTDPAMRARLKEIAERTAALFDEIILDDFYFTNCTCERCIREKGDRDWVTFRRELMRDVSENLTVGPAKAVNPKVRMIIKYPNWRESYGVCPGGSERHLRCDIHRDGDAEPRIYGPASAGVSELFAGSLYGKCLARAKRRRMVRHLRLLVRGPVPRAGVSDGVCRGEGTDAFSVERFD